MVLDLKGKILKHFGQNSGSHSLSLWHLWSHYFEQKSMNDVDLCRELSCVWRKGPYMLSWFNKCYPINCLIRSVANEYIIRFNICSLDASSAEILKFHSFNYHKEIRHQIRNPVNRSSSGKRLWWWAVSATQVQTQSRGLKGISST